MREKRNFQLHLKRQRKKTVIVDNMAINDFKMEFLDYINRFHNTIKNQTNFESSTIDEYLNVFAELPPPFERSYKSDVMAELYCSQGKKKAIVIH